MSRIVFDRLPAVRQALGKGPTKIYDDIARGTFVPPVKSGRMSFWPRHEVDAIAAAILSGADEDKLRALVKSLVAARQSAGTQVAGAAA